MLAAIAPVKSRVVILSCGCGVTTKTMSRIAIVSCCSGSGVQHTCAKESMSPAFSGEHPRDCVYIVGPHCCSTMKRKFEASCQVISAMTEGSWNIRYSTVGPVQKGQAGWCRRRRPLEVIKQRESLGTS